MPVATVFRPLRDAGWVNRERLTRWGYGFAAITLVAILWRASVTIGGAPLGWDFINYYAGASAATRGEAGLAYDRQWFAALEQAVSGIPASWGVYSYPPPAMLLSLPIAQLPLGVALIVWSAVGVGLVFAMLRRLVGTRQAAIAVIAAPAALCNLMSGQAGYFTAALLAGGLMLLERRPILAGVCFGGLCYKPHLGLLLPLVLVADRRWSTFLAAAATVVVLGAGSLVLFGHEAWAGFIHNLGINALLIEEHTARWYRIPTVFVGFRALGAPRSVCYAAQAISALCALAAVIAVWRSSVSREVKSAALAIAVFLATPYAWDYDMVVLVFAAAWIGCEGLRNEFLPWERLSILLLLTMPLLADAAGAAAGVPVAPILMWLALLALVGRAAQRRTACDERRHHASPSGVMSAG